jgi:hypothetical protein
VERLQFLPSAYHAWTNPLENYDVEAPERLPMQTSDESPAAGTTMIHIALPAEDFRLHHTRPLWHDTCLTNFLDSFPLSFLLTLLDRRSFFTCRLNVAHLDPSM